MFGYQQCEVCILCLFGRIFIAVAICCDNAVCIFIYHDAVRVHTEGTDIILELLGTVYDLALIQLIGQMGEDNSRKFHTDAQVDTVGLRRDLQIFTDSFHLLPLRPTEMIHCLQVAVSFLP